MPTATKGIRPLSAADFIIERDAEDWDDHRGLWSFYLTPVSNVDEMFGTNVETSLNGDYINVYAFVHPGFDGMEENLEITLCKEDGSDEYLVYPLSETEKESLLSLVLEYKIKDLTKLRNELLAKNI